MFRRPLYRGLSRRLLFPLRTACLSRARPCRTTTLSHATCLSTRAFSASCAQRIESGRSLVDEKMEEIQELYAAARDEFEIAAEETEGNTVYAEDDRIAAREALTELQKAYKDATEGADAGFAEEVNKRVGPRIRELENAVTAMEEMAQNHD